jgi:hypothetical protein
MPTVASKSNSSSRAATFAALQHAVRSLGKEALCAALSEQLAAGGWDPHAAVPMAAFVQEISSVSGSKYFTADGKFTAAGTDALAALAVKAGMRPSDVGTLDQVMAAAVRKLLHSTPQQSLTGPASGTAAATAAAAGGSQDAARMRTALAAAGRSTGTAVHHAARPGPGVSLQQLQQQQQQQRKSELGRAAANKQSEATDRHRSSTIAAQQAAIDRRIQIEDAVSVYAAQQRLSEELAAQGIAYEAPAELLELVMLGIDLAAFAEEYEYSTSSSSKRYLAADGTYTAAGNAELARIDRQACAGLNPGKLSIACCCVRAISCQVPLAAAACAVLVFLCKSC